MKTFSLLWSQYGIILASLFSFLLFLATLSFFARRIYYRREHNKIHRVARNMIAEAIFQSASKKEKSKSIPSPKRQGEVISEAKGVKNAGSQTDRTY